MAWGMSTKRDSYCPMNKSPFLQTFELAPGNSWSNHCWPMNCAMYSGRGVGGGEGVGVRGGGVGVFGGDGDGLKHTHIITTLFEG